ncbi:MAG: DNA mismatch repair protein MutS [Deltaproteobacteria bacterium]|nr:DNA mismatch repair protein MutS [Deltaproteobacteria bacterium]
MNPSSATPMIQQYLAVKEEYPDAILFYRMGDFFEMFFEDAEKASRLLDITLTSRNKKADTPIPMCGVPHRAAQNYIARLIEKGYKVAICDQVEDPGTAKGLVKREVVRVVTPGMILENELLDASSNNYVLSAVFENNRIGLAYLDISTGTFRVMESGDMGTVIEETFRISPSEVILPPQENVSPHITRYMEAVKEFHPTALEAKAFEYRPARNRLLKSFGTVSLEGFGCETLRQGVRAAGALVFYVQETQKQPLEHIHRIETYSLDSYLFMDDQSYKNLEIEKNLHSNTRKGTLLSTMDMTMTAMGSRMLKQWMRYPLTDPTQIIARYDALDVARNQYQSTCEIRDLLHRIYDVERLRSKISMGHANARDLLSLKQSLQNLPAISRLLATFQSPLFELSFDQQSLESIALHIEQAIREDAPPTLHEGGMVKEGFDPALDELIQLTRDGKNWLVNLEKQEKERTGITALKVRYNKVFGYYLEIPKTRLNAVPDHYIRKQTLVNAERFITEELKRFEEKVMGAEDKRAEMEFDILNTIKALVMGKNDDLEAAGVFLARLDCLLTLAIVSLENNYTRPDINTEGILHIQDGRHPVIEKMIAGERFVPNTLSMDNHQNKVLIITWPNMAGKSTVLRQVALTVLMAQMGSFVPAKKTSINITDRIFTRVGALDNLSQGQSTFLVEMQETANILNHASQESLVIMDEIGRGTSTFDGLSIAWAVAEYLHDLNGNGVKTLFATHYHELTELSKEKERVKNFNITVKEWNDEIIFLRKLVEGGTNRSYGIQVARLAGIPETVIRRATRILAYIENKNPKLPSTRDQHRTTDRRQPLQVQLELFKGYDDRIIKEIQALDIARMTPLDALNFLHSLQDKVQSPGRFERDRTAPTERN